MADDVVYLQGEGGAIFTWDRAKLAKHPPIQQRIEKGHIRLVNADGSRLGSQAADQESASVDGAPARPGERAVKAEWVTYAVNTLGMDPDDAEAATKQDLIDLAGE